MRIVLDTTILLDALFERDKQSQTVLDYVKNRTVEAFVSKEILAEYADLFSDLCVENNAGFGTEEYRRYLRLYSRALVVFQYCNVRQKHNVYSDAGDNRFFDCAYEANADYIVTDDPHEFIDRPLKNRNGNLIIAINPYKLLNAISRERLAARFTVK
jgi:putative PIN family toxin of toxin-antitoxin system